eukprot:COSAG05_NODE_1026_length_6118_cov_13.075096_1_plen_359_part_00
MSERSKQTASDCLDGRVIEGKLGRYTMPSPPQWIGGGSSANVFLAVNQDTNEKVAVKAIDRDSLEESARKRTLLTRELNITTKLRDPNIINLMEVIFDDNYVMLIMEFAADGELYEAVKDGPMEESKARRVFFQIASALGYCHQQGVCHRDLKLENLLLVDRHELIVKVADFGLSKDATNMSIAKTKVGTISYMAPEVTNASMGAGTADGYDGVASDVWSLGVILYVLLVCDYPFGYDGPGGQSTPEVCRRIRQGEMNELPGHLSGEVVDLIHRMLDIDWSRRAKIEEILAHPWVAREERRETTSGLYRAASSIDHGEVVWPDSGGMAAPPQIEPPMVCDDDDLNGGENGYDSDDLND